MNSIKAVIIRKNAPLPEERFRGLMEQASEELKQRASRMHRRGDAENTLLANALAKKMLAPYADTLVFERNPHGKPFLPGFPDLHFNLTHSGCYIACAVAPVPVGIDVQTIAIPKNNIAKRYFTEREQQYIAGAGDTAFYFCRIWTMKESYLKRDGKGLSVPLNSFDVLMQQGGLFRETALEGALCQICCDPAIPHEIVKLDIGSETSYNEKLPGG